MKIYQINQNANMTQKFAAANKLRHYLKRKDITGRIPGNKLLLNGVDIMHDHRVEKVFKQQLLQEISFKYFTTIEAALRYYQYQKNTNIDPTISWEIRAASILQFKLTEQIQTAGALKIFSKPIYDYEEDEKEKTL